MNFEEKLIKLRKEKAFSQEEMGEKLNVTRQTISKWELGQSKPDMDKLLEISKLFNISVEDLTSNENKMENKDKDRKKETIEKEPRKWLQILLIIVALIIIVVLIDKIITDRKAKEDDSSSTGIMGVFNNFSHKFDNITLNLENEKKSFNFLLESYSGTKTGFSVKHLLEDIVTSNKTNSEHIITVTYKENITSNEDEIVSIKTTLDDWGEYEVSLEYDENGYINNVTFVETAKYLAEKEKRIEEEQKKKMEEQQRKVESFNRGYELYTGTSWGISCGTILDKVVTNNKTNGENILLVSYGDTETSDPDEIINIKQTLNNKTNQWKEYEVSLEYNDDGYVYKIVIEKI